MSKVKIIPWDQSSAIHIDHMYTTLSWVRDDRRPSGVTQEELNDYTDIFKGDKYHPNPKRLLVYGRPGIGKTTVSKKMAFDWSQQKKRILKRFDVVLLIKLRDVCDKKSIREVLSASKLLAGDEVVDDVYGYIFRNQEKVLLILDGYDEYNCSGEQSPVHDIWEGTQLRDSHVIITTRKEKADELRYHSHVQFEINRFQRDHQVRAFASNFLEDKQKVEEFVTYLDERHLKDLAEIPLLLLMLCTVWKENRFSELPKSRAHICQNFIETLILHTFAKDGKAKQVIEAYNVEFFALSKLAFDALLQNVLSFPVDKLPDSILSEKLIKVGLVHVLNVATFLKCEQQVHFIHKSVQEYLAAFYLREELLRETSTTCLSQVDSLEKIVKMIEVLRFACQLSAHAAYAVFCHLVIVMKKHVLTEYSFTDTRCVEDFSSNQKELLTLISQSLFCCSVEKRRELYPMFVSYVSVLLIDSDQLHSVANEHFLTTASAPELIFFHMGGHTGQSYQDLISVVEDLSAVVVSCSGEKKASDFLKKYSLENLDDIFLKKEEGKIYLYIARIESTPFPTEMLKELISSPESTRKKKPVSDQSNEQEDSSTLCLTENSTSDTLPIQHCLSYVWLIFGLYVKRQQMEMLIGVLPFVTSPREIIILGRGSAADPELANTLVSRINFTNRLVRVELRHINLTAKLTAVIARSLHQAPNLSMLDLSWNPLGEGVSDLTRHLSCAPHLELFLHGVKMTKEQVNDLSEAVRQTKIKQFWSYYHVSFAIFVAICFNCLP